MFAVEKSLAFPTENEESVKRRALNVCQDHMRNVLDVTRKVPQMIDYFLKNDKDRATQLFNEVTGSEADVDRARRLVSQELAEIGAILLSREDFLRFTNLTGEIADFSEGIAFRLVEIMQHKWNVPMDIKKDLLKLSEAVFETVLKLREMAMALNYGSIKTMEKARDVEIAEQDVDALYRELEIKLLGSKVDFPALILLKDVLQLLEDSADKAEDASDAARILSLVV
jgi:predicted phosphate transport protein (TIGR00153 family)